MKRGRSRRCRARDQQVERELHGVALDVRHALGAAALVALARSSAALRARRSRRPARPDPARRPDQASARLCGESPPCSAQSAERTTSALSSVRPIRPSAMRQVAAACRAERAHVQSAHLPDCAGTSPRRDAAGHVDTASAAAPCADRASLVSSPLSLAALAPRRRLRRAQTAAQPAAAAAEGDRRGGDRRARSPNGTSSPAGSKPVQHRRGPAARLRLRLGRPLRRRRGRQRRATCCSRSTRGRSRPKSIACAPSWRAPTPRSSAPAPSCSAPSGSRAENAMSREEHERRAAFAARSRRRRSPRSRRRCAPPS